MSAKDKAFQGRIHKRHVTQQWSLESGYLHQPQREKATFETSLIMVDSSQMYQTLSIEMDYAEGGSLHQSHVRSKGTNISVVSRVPSLSMDRACESGERKPQEVKFWVYITISGKKVNFPRK